MTALLIRKKSTLSFSWLLLTAGVLLFSSCKKYEEENIPGNEPPPDQTIERVTIENYVNKIYISALGREPSTAEFDFGLNLLLSQNVSMSSRNQLLDSVFVHDEYKQRFYERSMANLLPGVDSIAIVFYIYAFQLALLDTSQMALWDIYQMELDRLRSLEETPDSVAAGTISFKEVHRRLVDNFFYDQINMGSFNFVVSMYQHFLDRYPTMNEITSGVNMVNGFPDIVFLQAGLNKTDYEHIFFSSIDYYEGAVRDLYQLYLYRQPTSVEMENGTLLYMNSGDYVSLQKLLLSSNEFIGI